MDSQCSFELDEILSILPHRPPFLFIDRVVKLTPHKEIVAERALREDEPHFAGHFPGHAIMPGVLIADALAQTSGLLTGLSAKVMNEEDAGSLFFLGAVNLKFPASAFPGDMLRMTARPEGNVGNLSRFAVEACVGRKLVAKGSLTLAMMVGTA